MKRILALVGGGGLIVASMVAGTGQAAGSSRSTIHDAVTGRLQPTTVKFSVGPRHTSVVKRSAWLSSGTLAAAQDSMVIPNRDERAQAADAAPKLQIHGTVSPVPDTLGCLRGAGPNVRVNQDCTFRRQAEEEIVANPANPRNLLAGQNDSRVGFNQCGIDYSLDAGRTWGDQLPPFRQKLNNPPAQLPTTGDPNQHTILGDPGTLHTYDAASDPAVAFDSAGRGFFSCVVFDVASNASGLFVTQSPADAHGAYFDNIGSTLGDRGFMVAEDNSPLVAHDKNFIAADAYPTSPNRDNVYVTWTVFRFSAKCRGGTSQAPAFCTSAIYGSMSTDHAVTWSTPEEISGQSPLCPTGALFDPSRPADECNNDQGSDPIVLPNGSLVVPFNNGNTAATNPNGQQLAVSCRPSGSSTAGTAHLNCAAPTKVGDDVVSGAPLCDFGRGPEECIPGAFIRTNDFPRSAVSTSKGDVYVTWQDYRHGRFDIQLAVSHDGGASWSSTVRVNRDTARDHYFPAVDVGESAGADRVAVSYYRTDRVPGENTTPNTGFTPGRDPGVGAKQSDYVLSSGRGFAAAPYRSVRLSPEFPPPDGVQTGFNGDYSGIVVVGSQHAHPIWSDTRNAVSHPDINGATHDEDVFTANKTLP